MISFSCSVDVVRSWPSLLSDVSSAYKSPETAGVHRGLCLTDRLPEPPGEVAASRILLKKGLRAGKETRVKDAKCSTIVHTAGFHSPHVKSSEKTPFSVTAFAIAQPDVREPRPMRQQRATFVR